MKMNFNNGLKISIAMATYNGGKYLREQLESFLAQTRLPDELIITDDCSTDDTLAIIQDFASSAPFEVFWEQSEKNLGYTGNFNKSLLRTTGDLVFLSDQDDVWFPNKIECIEHYSIKYPKDLVLMNNAALTDENLNDSGYTKLEQIKSAGLSDSSFVMGCCAAVRRELLNLCLPIPSRFKAHDDWIVKMAEGIERKRIFKDVLQYYRRHETNKSQFIANKTERITTATMFKRKILQHIKYILRRGIYKERISYKTEMTNLFLHGVREAYSRSEPPLSNEIKKLIWQLEQQIIILETHMRILDKVCYKRVPLIVEAWKNGFYKKRSGVKSAINDLIVI